MSSTGNGEEQQQQSISSVSFERESSSPEPKPSIISPPETGGGVSSSRGVVSFQNSPHHSQHSNASSRPFSSPVHEQKHVLSAIIIQAYWRRFQAKKRCRQMHKEQQEEKTAQDKTAAATLVQAVVRGMLERRKHAFRKGQVKMTDHKARQHAAAALIQAVVRGKEDRELTEAKIRDRASLHRHIQEEDAAKTIQRSFRKYSNNRTPGGTAGMAVRRQRKEERDSQQHQDEQTASNQETALAQKMIRSLFARATMKRLRRVRLQSSSSMEALAREQEEQFTLFAARRIQGAFRCYLARKEAGNRRGEVLRINRKLQEDEGVAVLGRFYHKITGDRLRAERQAQRVQREELKRLNGSATIIQAWIRGELQRKKYIALVKQRNEDRIFSAARKIQCLARSRQARRMHARLAFEKQAEDDSWELNESATNIQRLRRGQLSRRRTARMRASLYLSSAVASLGRGFIARRQLGTRRRDVLAALVIQKRARVFLARMVYKTKLAKHKLAVLTLRRNQAAVLIQRNWKKKEAAKELEDRKAIRKVEDQAASFIQRRAKVLIARAERKHLMEQEEDEIFEVELEKNVVMIQNCVRRFLARTRYLDIQESRRKTKLLITSVFSGYQERVVQSRRRQVVRAQRAVEIISHGWKQCISMREAKAAVIARREEVNTIKTESNAACLIQRRIRGWSQRKAFEKVQERRLAAALRIERKARLFLAKKRTEMLRQKALEHKMARKIQVRWQEVKENVRERREEREMEAQLLAMEYVAIFRREDLHRRAILAAEEEETLAYHHELSLAIDAIVDREEKKISAWKQRAPAELQQDAAVKVQSFFRGFSSRKETLDENSPLRGALTRNNSFTKARRELPQVRRTKTNLSGPVGEAGDNIGLRSRRASSGALVPPQQSLLFRTNSSSGRSHSSMAAQRPLSSFDQPKVPPLKPSGLATEEDEEWEYVPEGDFYRKREVKGKDENGGAGKEGQSLRGSDAMAWLAWLADRPDVNKRCFERLLLREAASRRRITKAFEADFTFNPPRSQGKSSSVGSAVCREDSPPAAALATTSGKTTPRTLPPIRSAQNSPSAVVGQLGDDAGVVQSSPTNKSKNSTVRHLAALSTAEELTRRANDTLSLHPAVSAESTAMISRLTNLNETPKHVEPPEFTVSEEGTVDLRGQGLTEALLRPILHKLRSETKLRVLLLDGNPLRDMALVDISDLLSYNSDLIHLSLANTSITDVGMSHLVAALRRNTTLISVEIANTCISERYRQHLHAMMEHRAKVRLAAGSHQSEDPYQRAQRLTREMQQKAAAKKEERKANEAGSSTVPSPQQQLKGSRSPAPRAKSSIESTQSKTVAASPIKLPVVKKTTSPPPADRRFVENGW